MTIALDIISDPICPWCYIGKAKLDRALEARADHPLALRWHPFQLNPDMPPEGMDRRAYLEQKFGGPAGADRVYGAIEEAAKAAGLDIDFAAMTRTPNTIDAHRLIHWAGIEGRQSLVANQLFHRYFRMGEDLGDHTVLVETARSAGLDADMIARLLATDSDVAEIRAADERARSMGVQGVPTFLIGGRYAVTGAQETDTWMKIIDELVEKASEFETADTSAE